MGQGLGYSHWLWLICCSQYESRVGVDWAGVGLGLCTVGGGEGGAAGCTGSGFLFGVADYWLTVRSKW